MKVNQIYELANDLCAQAYGSEAIKVTSLEGLIAMGDKVLDSSKDKELFANALVDRIGKIIIQQRVYAPRLKNILIDSITYGAAIEKVYVEPGDATENEAWKLDEGTDIGPGTLTKNVVKVKIFDNRNTWKYTSCIPEYQMDSAFTGPSEFVAFVDSVMNAVNTSLNTAMEQMVNMCIANFIGEKIAYATEPTSDSDDTPKNHGLHAINLLHEYNTATNESLTQESALRNADFYKFAGRRIHSVLSLMSSIGVLFNTEGYKRFTDKENLHVLFQTDFAGGMATYLEADTFHKELVALPNYEEVPYWQGTGVDGTIEDKTTINIVTSSGKTVEQSYVIGFAFDNDALGVMFDHVRQNAWTSPSVDVTKYWFKADKGYFNDLSENGVVFYLGEA